MAHSPMPIVILNKKSLLIKRERRSPHRQALPPCLASALLHNGLWRIAIVFPPPSSSSSISSAITLLDWVRPAGLSAIDGNTPNGMRWVAGPLGPGMGSTLELWYGHSSSIATFMVHPIFLHNSLVRLAFSWSKHLRHRLPMHRVYGTNNISYTTLELPLAKVIHARVL